MSSLAPMPRGPIGSLGAGGDVTLTEYFRRWLSDLRTWINTQVPNYVPPGAVMPTFAAENVGTTWLLLNGQSVSKHDYADLYAVIGDTFGSTATEFTLPNMAGRTVMGAGAVPLKAIAGSASVTLAIGQLPSHGHSVTDPGHGHTFTGTPHSHAITDPGHTHTAGDVGALEALAGTDKAKAVSGTTGSATTGITIDAATAGGTISSAATGITVGNTGSGDPIDITPPVIGVNWLIKT